MPGGLIGACVGEGRVADFLCLAGWCSQVGGRGGDVERGMWLLQEERDRSTTPGALIRPEVHRRHWVALSNWVAPGSRGTHFVITFLLCPCPRVKQGPAAAVGGRAVVVDDTWWTARCKWGWEVKACCVHFTQDCWVKCTQHAFTHHPHMHL